ncbi:MAG: Wadjet anti-phage system protein JetD domain-containing protein [Phycisphaeraceae bacterium]
MRSTRPGVVVRAAEDGSTVPVADLTRLAGGAALLLDDERTWQFAGTVAVVENAEAFWRHHRVLNVDLAIYTAGRMSSRRLLAWLSSNVMSDCSYLHWGDYDPVGAAEYLRLCEACPGRVQMHLPNNLDALVARYGKRELLVDQLDTLRHVRHFTADAVIAQLVDIWDRRQRGLEQELLLRSEAGLRQGC